MLVFTHVFNPALGPGWQHAAGWETYFDRLDAHLAGGYLSEEDAHEGIDALMERYRERFAALEEAGERGARVAGDVEQRLGEDPEEQRHARDDGHEATSSCRRRRAALRAARLVVGLRRAARDRRPPARRASARRRALVGRAPSTPRATTRR